MKGLVRLKAKGCENLFRSPTGTIYFKMYRKGRGEVVKSTRTTEVGLAKVRADELRAEFFGEAPKINRGKKLCGELFPAWIERKRVTCRPRTVTSIEGTWKHLKPFLEFKTPDHITAAWWETVYVPTKRAEFDEDRKFFNDRKWLSMFLLALRRDGLPLREEVLVNVDAESEGGEVYTDAEIAAILAASTPQLNLTIKMALTMGMRKGEITQLTWDRIDMVQRVIILRDEHVKTGKGRTFKISPEIYAIFEKMTHTPTGPLLRSRLDGTKTVTTTGFNRPWARCKALCGVTKRFHDLRHTFLTRAFKAPEANTALICAYAGLSMEMAERVYLHIDSEDTKDVAGLVSIKKKLRETEKPEPVTT